MAQFQISCGVPVLVFSAAILASTTGQLFSQDASLDTKDQAQESLFLSEFRPVSRLKVKSHDLRKAKFPVVDVHTHFSFRLRDSPEKRDAFIDVMNRNNIAVCVSLDAKLGPNVSDHIAFLGGANRDRFVVFAHIDWQGSGDKEDPSTWDCQRDDFARQVAVNLRTAKELGISGLKLFKRFGLNYKNPDGTLIRIDDPRWDPIWAVCGALNLPVIIHTADPEAFFDPIDKHNERWEELSRHTDWSFHGKQFPRRDELLAARNRVIARHEETVFIGAHMANNPEDLGTVSKWLDRFPNLYIEMASRIGELGRQPYTARDFFLKYADRIMFGTDGPQPETRLHLYWRFLETKDEYFPYSEKEFPPQGFWNIYGINLPDEVLRKVYFENASRLIPGVHERVEKWRNRGLQSDVN